MHWIFSIAEGRTIPSFPRLYVLLIFKGYVRERTTVIVDNLQILWTSNFESDSHPVKNSKLLQLEHEIKAELERKCSNFPFFFFFTWYFI